MVEDAYHSGLTSVTKYVLPHLSYVGYSRKGGGFIKLEDITLPLRFAALTVHLVTLLMIFLDRKNYVIHYAGKANSSDSAMLFGATVTGLACFAIEYITLLAGVTIFQRGLTFLNTLIHIVGLAIMIYFYLTPTNPITILVVVLLVNAVPAVSELLCWWYLLSASYSSY